jgi:hypothetical protein
MIATMCTKHVATGQGRADVRRARKWGISAEPTWLEEDSVRYFYISRVAIWLNSLRRAHERAHNECGGLTNVVK